MSFDTFKLVSLTIIIIGMFAYFEELKLTISQQEVTIGKLQASIAIQNTAIDTAQKVHDDVQANLVSAMDQNKKITYQFSSLKDIINKRKIPVTCEDGLKNIKVTAKNIAIDWNKSNPSYNITEDIK